jgi:hypothetical protein
LIVLLLAIAGAVVFLIKGGGEETVEDPEKSEKGAEASEKPANAK